MCRRVPGCLAAERFRVGSTLRGVPLLRHVLGRSVPIPVPNTIFPFPARHHYLTEHAYIRAAGHQPRSRYGHPPMLDESRRTERKKVQRCGHLNTLARNDGALLAARHLDSVQLASIPSVIGACRSSHPPSKAAAKLAPALALPGVVLGFGACPSPGHDHYKPCPAGARESPA